jgi:orotate phosphoribosyltransferase-like protein
MINLISENKTQFPEVDLLGVAKRQNNPKRTFIIVNKLQAKHIPVAPDISLGYFRLLGQLAARTCRLGEQVLVIAFAETATAIGAAVSEEIIGSVYCHTTRENIFGMVPIVQFIEEHSHAINHALFLGANLELRNFDRIVFIDDEITTGKTVLNVIYALKNERLIKENVKFTVAALIFNENAEDRLDRKIIDICFLTRIGTSGVNVFNSVAEECISSFPQAIAAAEIKLTYSANPRIGIAFANYKRACVLFAKRGAAELNIDGGNILVLGTEEFMYPALLLGSEIKKTADRVYCHATTRSPITAFNDESYPIRSQCKLPSLYDSERTSYVYNLCKYDAVVIATDALPNPKAEILLCGALKQFGNDNIYIARWTN